MSEPFQEYKPTETEQFPKFELSEMVRPVAVGFHTQSWTDREHVAWSEERDDVTPKETQ